MRGLVRVSSLIAAAVFVASIAPVARGADTVTVDAQVTLSAPCLTVSPSQFDFGTLSFGGAQARPIQYVNCGSLDERIYARGTHATGPAGTWSLSPTFSYPCQSSAALDQYGAALFNTEGFDEPLGIFDRLLETVPRGVAGSAAYLRVLVACQGSVGGGSTMSFHVTFTATF